MKTIKQQEGAITLMITMIILLSMTFITLCSAQNTLLELKVSDNYLSREHAIAKAETKLAETLKVLSKLNINKIMNDEYSEINHHPDINPDKNYRIELSYRERTANVALVDLSITYKPNNNNVSYTIQQKLLIQPLINSAPPFPLIVRGNIYTHSIEQGEGTATPSIVLSGGSLQFGEESTGQNSISPSCLQGICTEHEMLAALNGNEFYQRILNIDTNNSTVVNNLQEFIKAYDNGDRIITIANDIAFERGMHYGSLDNPLLLTINGNLDLGSYTTLNGVIYMKGETFSGNPDNSKIIGALFAENDLHIEDIRLTSYEKKIIDKLNNLTTASITAVTPISGSWRNF